MTAIFVKPAPTLPLAVAKILKSDTGVGLLDAAGNVPESGMPWPMGGLTARLLTDGTIFRADDPIFTVLAVPDEPAPSPSASTSPVAPPDPAPEAAPAH